ncbi:MAG TPA: hypothetical protein VFV72_11945 [Candidatus Limnocylindrales bacterium]|nr:hypothetical protein [Candidatus Limnocylindrales bacterium]
MPDATAPGGSRRQAGPARHELPAIDEAALATARTVDAMLRAARSGGHDRWATFLGPLPDRLRDGDLRELRATALRVRAAYGPKDSVRDALPEDVTEPAMKAVDRLLKALARHDARGDR